MFITASIYNNQKKFKKLITGFRNDSGRSNKGNISVFSKTGRLHNLYKVDFYRNFLGTAICIYNLKNPSSNNILSLIKYFTGSYSYILAPNGFIPGMVTQTPSRLGMLLDPIKLSYSVFLKYVPLNSICFNVPSFNSDKCIYARSAGSFCTVIKIDKLELFVTLRLPSNKTILLNSEKLVTLGRSSNYNFYKTCIGIAGKNIRLGKKPSVRGVAMNPVDHPHGGRTKTNSPEKTPWGKLTKVGK